MKHFVLATIALLLSISLHSEEKRLALVIGNSNYGKNPLANPVNDAKSIEVLPPSMSEDKTRAVSR